MVPLAFVVFISSPAITVGSASQPAIVRPVQPTIVPYHSGMQVPPGAYVKKKTLAGLWGAGIGLLAVSWASTFATTMVLCQAGCTKWAVPVSFIPVFGPITDATISVPPVALFMVAMAILQAGSVGMIVGGAVAAKKYLVLTGNGVAGQF